MVRHAAPALPRERHGELAERYRFHYFARQHEILMFDGALAMLSALKQRNHLLAVATGKSRRSLDEALQPAPGGFTVLLAGCAALVPRSVTLSEADLLARIRSFDFGAKDVDLMVVTWPVDFLPS